MKTSKAITIELQDEIKEYKSLMKEVLQALNQIKNTKVDTKNFKNTYEICSKLSTFINK